MKHYGPANSGVTMSGGLDAMIGRLVDQTPRVVLAEMTMSANSIDAIALARWPVSKRKKPQHSRDTIATGSEPHGVGIATFVVVPVPYAFYIKSNQNGLNGKSPWQELIRKPGLKEGKALAERCADDLARLAGGK